VVRGRLPRKELHEAAQDLTVGQAGLIAVGEPTIEKAVDKALTSADKVVKRTVSATADEIPASCRKPSGVRDQGSMSVPQFGIFARGTHAHHFLEFDLRPGSRHGQPSRRSGGWRRRRYRLA
jgi:hypothetical protein